MGLLGLLRRSNNKSGPSGTLVEETPSVKKEMSRPVRAMSYKEASVTYPSGYRRSGIVLDHSSNGVRMRFPTNERLPDVIMLNAKCVSVSGRAQVVWQEQSEAGLQLI